MPGTVLLCDAVQEYLTSRQVRVAATTYENDRAVLRRFVSTVCEGRDIQVKNLTPHHGEAWLRALRKQHRDLVGRNREPITGSTWNFYRARLKSFFTFCMRRGWTRADLLTDVDLLPEARRIRQQPSASELWEMITGEAVPRERVVLALAANTGLRANEISSLKFRDIDLAGLTLRVWVSKSQHEDDMPITSDLRTELEAWIIHYEGALGRALRPLDHLVPAATGPRYKSYRFVDGEHIRDQAPSTYGPDRPMAKLHEVAQKARTDRTHHPI